jgi:hypothetical protein
MYIISYSDLQTLTLNEKGEYWFVKFNKLTMKGRIKPYLIPNVVVAKMLTLECNKYFNKNLYAIEYELFKDIYRLVNKRAINNLRICEDDVMQKPLWYRANSRMQCSRLTINMKLIGDKIIKLHTQED